MSVTGSSNVQATGEVPVKATQPVEAPGTRRGDVIQQNATQPVKVPRAGTATQPVEAPGAGPEVLLTSPVMLPFMLNRPLPVERLLIVPVGLTVRKIYRVSWVPLLLATSGTPPQTETST